MVAGSLMSIFYEGSGWWPEIHMLLFLLPGLVLCTEYRGLVASTCGVAGGLMFPLGKKLFDEKVGGMFLLPSLFMASFLMVLFNCLMGTVPWSYPVMAHWSVTCTVTFPLWLGLYVSCLRSGPVGFFASLVPKGVPELFGFFIFPIEIVSILCQIVSLSVRMMLNMAFGFMIIHVVMSILSSIVLGSGASVGGIMMVLVASGVLGAEFFVCMIQSGLLFGLLCMYSANHPGSMGYASYYCSVTEK
uniref:ATP synthase F0 subunit 6 n=1 Tax=Pinna rudis TaxID=1380992 RepID=UPI001EDEE19A|nr:ATP synthase F0 subunit 6 [Pinna rudis]BCX41852.1 ATP synthase F0 subunit 6 [Pinna rudis]